MTINLTYNVEIPEKKIHKIIDDEIEYILGSIKNGWYYSPTIYETYDAYIVNWDYFDTSDEEFHFFMQDSKTLVEETWKIFRDYMIEKLKENNIKLEIGEERFKRYVANLPHD